MHLYENKTKKNYQHMYLSQSIAATHSEDDCALKSNKNKTWERNEKL